MAQIGAQERRPVNVIKTIGRQEDTGTYVLSRDVELTDKGELSMDGDYLWLNSYSDLPIECTIKLPLNENAGEKYYMLIREHVSQGHLVNVLLVAG